MTIERIDTLEDFQRLKTAWTTVYRNDPEAQFFLSWEWLAGVLETYPGRWILLVARVEASAYLSFLPLQC